MEWIYNFFISIYSALLHIATLFHPKARLFIKGRKNWKQQLLNWKTQQATDKRVIWMHCSSLGEMEQGKPVLEQLRKEQPNSLIVLTFFSPSGYEYQKNYKGADYIAYLPLDTAKNAFTFVNILQPEIALFVKYEFWHHFIKTLHNFRIPIVYFSVLFQPRHIYFKWYGSFFRKMLTRINHFFVQNEDSALLLQQIGIDQVTIGGDTRFDSAFANTLAPFVSVPIHNFTMGKTVVVSGSSWDKDDEFLAKCLSELPPHFVLIVAPHNIEETRIQEVSEVFKAFQPLRLSQIANDHPNASARVLIVDSIGKLKYLYRYASIVWLGGGFNKGIHNTVEAAVYGQPIFFGPRYQRFQEAIDLLQLGAAKSVSEHQYEAIRSLFQEEATLATQGQKALQYALQQQGATKKIVDYIVVKYLSTNA